MQVVTDSLVDRVLWIETANLESRLRAFALRDGNPAGVFIERFGSATAFAAEKLHDRFYNSVLGVAADTLEHLDAIERFYRAHSVEHAMEIAPGRLTEPLGLALARRGYAMIGFHVGLVRVPRAEDAQHAPPDGVTVEPVDPSDTSTFEIFLDTFLEGWGTNPKDLEAAKENVRGWRANPTWRCYLARIHGQPAGAAILDVRGTTGMLGSASTVPSMRGRRVQSALLYRRLGDAASLGVEIVVGGAYFGTTSMRNQQRAGFEIAFTRGIWLYSRKLSE